MSSSSSQILSIHSFLKSFYFSLQFEIYLLTLSIHSEVVGASVIVDEIDSTAGVWIQFSDGSRIYGSSGCLTIIGFLQIL